jgi:hypothetical protein
MDVLPALRRLKRARAPSQMAAAAAGLCINGEKPLGVGEGGQRNVGMAGHT